MLLPHFMTAPSGHHYTYQPQRCKRYLGNETWCEQEFMSAFELKSHRANCVWKCGEPGCASRGKTRKRDIDRHARVHLADKEKLERFSHLVNES